MKRASTTPAVIYCRFSPRPDAETSRSNELQIAECVAYADKQGYEVLGEPFTDAGKSGSEMNRVGLWNAVASVPRGGVLIVTEWHRLSRQVLIQETVLSKLRAKEARIETTKGDTAGPSETADRKLIRQILAAVDEFNREATAALTSARMQRMQSLGHKVSSQAPYGYRHEGKRIVKEPAEQAIVRRMLRSRAEGLSIYKIAKYLEEDGVVNRNGNPLTRMQVKRIIDRELKRTGYTPQTL